MNYEKIDQQANYNEDISNDASRKTYFHLRLSTQYVKFLWNGITIDIKNTN